MIEERFDPALSLSDVVIGKGQVRLRIDQTALNELADSIAVQGLLEPIIVCPAEIDPSKFEVLAGQRRFLACKQLGHKTIKAVVRGRPKDLTERKALSSIHR